MALSVSSVIISAVPSGTSPRRLVSNPPVSLGRSFSCAVAVRVMPRSTTIVIEPRTFADPRRWMQRSEPIITCSPGSGSRYRWKIGK